KGFVEVLDDAGEKVHFRLTNLPTGTRWYRLDRTITLFQRNRADERLLDPEGIKIDRRRDTYRQPAPLAFRKLLVEAAGKDVQLLQVRVCEGDELRDVAVEADERL